MKWYYNVGDKKAGPVDEEDILQLAEHGMINSDTPVWNEKISVWTPYGKIRDAAPGDPPRETNNEITRDGPDSLAKAAGDSGGICSECGRSFPVEDMIVYADSRICASCKPAFFQKIREGVDPSAGLIYAGFWIRFGAKFIDGLITGLMNALFSVVGSLVSLSYAATGVKGGLPAGGIAAIIVTYILQIVFGATYSTFFVGKFGATPGKMACGLKIVTPDGGKVSYGRALGRHFAEVLSAIIMGIGYIMAGFDQEKRALHDRICATRVIRNQTGGK